MKLAHARPLYPGRQSIRRSDIALAGGVILTVALGVTMGIGMEAGVTAEEAGYVPPYAEKVGYIAGLKATERREQIYGDVFIVLALSAVIAGVMLRRRERSVRLGRLALSVMLALTGAAFAGTIVGVFLVESSRFHL